MLTNMVYSLEFRLQAAKDLTVLPKDVQRRVLRKLERMRADLAGDVKRLSNFTPEYRLRVGDYRVLFANSGERIVVFRVGHRREIYHE